MIWLSKEQRHAGAYVLTNGERKAVVIAESEEAANKIFFMHVKGDPDRTKTVSLNTESANLEFIDSGIQQYGDLK